VTDLNDVFNILNEAKAYAENDATMLDECAYTDMALEFGVALTDMIDSDDIHLLAHGIVRIARLIGYLEGRGLPITPQIAQHILTAALEALEEEDDDLPTTETNGRLH
jgi:hypothetical protein